MKCELNPVNLGIWLKPQGCSWTNFSCGLSNLVHRWRAVQQSYSCLDMHSLLKCNLGESVLGGIVYFTQSVGQNLLVMVRPAISDESDSLNAPGHCLGALQMLH